MTTPLPHHVQVYLVGGAVRDRLLGLAPGDRDHVVVGASVQDMRDAGYRQVGRDFPVFLHPRTSEEHALARTERKSARGHTGFNVFAEPSVTLEEDLARRDFTINAIAEAGDGSLVDPFGARAISKRACCATSASLHRRPAARVARGALHGALRLVGFTIAGPWLMRTMVAEGELAELRPSGSGRNCRARCAAPLHRPSCAACACGRAGRGAARNRALYGVPQRAEYHPEVDTGVHVELVCDMAAQLARGDDLIGFAALCHDLGKALTPSEELPRHVMHEQRGIAPIIALCQRFKVPAEHRDLAVIASREHLNVHRLDELKAATVHELIARCDGFRKPGRIDQLATVCEADKRGRAGLSGCLSAGRPAAPPARRGACSAQRWCRGRPQRARGWRRTAQGTHRRDHRGTQLTRGHSAVVGSMVLVTRLTLLAGNPPRCACSCTLASSGARYSQ